MIWEDYFDEYKSVLLNLKKVNEILNKEINLMVYKLYNLSKKEIEIIERGLGV